MKAFQDISDLRDLLVIRDVKLVQKLQNTLMDGLNNGTSLFDLWMKEESNLIQKTAKAYGERVVIEFCLKSLDLPCNSSNIELLCNLYSLSALVFVQKDLAWFVVDGLLNSDNVHSIQNSINVLVDCIAPVALDVCQHLGVPDYLIQSPIYNDYIKYNEIENKGEYIETPKL